jgi:type IV pilus assembly protein PilN
MVAAEVARMSFVPGQLQALDTQLREEKAKLDQQTKANEGLARGLVAVASGSALLTQLAQLTPQGVQITQATVSGQSLSLKGRADEPSAFTRVNALSLLLAYAPLFQPDQVRVIKLSREAAAVPAVGWDLAAGFATLKPAEQLPLLRKLGADGMVKRLQDLARTGVLP